MRNGRSRQPAVEPVAVAAQVRCAIYTRKSTDEGLTQEFNSLDAQREAAQAYIASQRHEGWVAVPGSYDDGGFSGGNMERPALRHLLADIDAGLVDCVVVYKVDRLSRSLLDFARMMEVFDRRGVSFVSVTQQFNTTASLGRLTLNILLSFAQFEREIIAERTRDKMSAARRKGKWVGGIPVLGYDVDPRGGRLLVNEREAQRVRAIFDLYLEYRSLIPVVREVNLRGWTTKRWTTKDGREHHGQPFTKNALFRLLNNVIYTGQVNHKGTVYAGEHDVVVPLEVWQRVQEQLAANGREGGREICNKYGALLKGILFCESCGTGMLHSYTVKTGRCYRYYVCVTAQQKGWDACATKSVNAYDIEQAVVDRIRGMGTDRRVAAETVRRVREQHEGRVADLRLEVQSRQKELSRLNRELVMVAGTTGGNGMRLDRMAELQEQIRPAEHHLRELTQELAAVEREAVEERDVLDALAAFDPIWRSLKSQEQIRIIRVLIDRIGYDGITGRVSVSFRSAGFKALCGLIGGGE